MFGAEHLHRQRPPPFHGPYPQPAARHWLARGKASCCWTARPKLASTEWTDLPDENGWRWFASAQAQRETTGDYQGQQRTPALRPQQSGARIDRNYFLQYDYANSQGLNAPPSGTAISVNYGWTGRYFNSTVAPTRGHGLAVELGAGTTLHPDRAAFVRTLVRWQSFIAAGRVQAETGGARNARIALRAEAGAVMARQTAQIPGNAALSDRRRHHRAWLWLPRHRRPHRKTTCFMAAAIWAWPASNGSAPSFTTAP